MQLLRQGAVTEPPWRRARFTAPNEEVAADFARILSRRGYGRGTFAAGFTYRRDGLVFEWSEASDDCPTCFRTPRYCDCQ